MKVDVKAHLALLTVAILYGTNYIIAKGVMSSGLISPPAFIVMRVVGAGAVIWLFHMLVIREKMDTSDLPYTAMCALFGVAINQLCFFQGLSETSPIHASLIMITTPIIVLIGSYFILQEKVTLYKVMGILLGLLGAAILILSAGGAHDSLASVRGDIFILINASSYALYLVLARKLLLKYHPLTVVKWIFFFGFFFILPFGYSDVIAVPYHLLTPSHLWGIAYVVLGVTFSAYVLNAFALSRVKPSVVSFYIYFQPLIASAISILIGQDKLDITKIMAAVLLFLAVYLVTIVKKK